MNVICNFATSCSDGGSVHPLALAFESFLRAEATSTPEEWPWPRGNSSAGPWRTWGALLAAAHPRPSRPPPRELPTQRQGQPCKATPGPEQALAALACRPRPDPERAPQ